MILPIVTLLIRAIGGPFRLPDIPPAYPLGLLGLAFLYAVARVNYERFAALQAEIETLREAKVSREAIQKLVELRAIGGGAQI